MKDGELVLLLLILLPDTRIFTKRSERPSDAGETFAGILFMKMERVRVLLDNTRVASDDESGVVQQGSTQKKTRTSGNFFGEKLRKHPCF